MTSTSGQITANRVDILARRITWCSVHWEDGRISAIEEHGPERPGQPYLLPGLVDAHVHIESAMLPPAEFARMAIRHGVLAAVCDPHEIANVLGVEGVRYMVRNAAQSPFLFAFGAPSCVPATPFETAGARLDASDIEALFEAGEAQFLAEVMNFPGVLDRDPALMAKLEAARRHGLPVDGHAPGLCGTQAAAYAGAGISTDHECSSLEEAEDKIAAGMYILIREGSAARNLDALLPLLGRHPERVMFCSDDKHPDDLSQRHIDHHLRQALAAGHDLFDALRAASLNPTRHYRLPLGLLQVGDRFDAQRVDNLQDLHCLDAWLAGQQVLEQGRVLLPFTPADCPNRFDARPIAPADIDLPAQPRMRAIQAQDGQLLTRETWLRPRVEAGQALPDPGRDQLLLVVLNRYQPAKPAVALITGFGLRRGAIAGSVAHDSHNIVAVGCSREAIAAAINRVIEDRGGLALVDGDELLHLPLPIAGLMSPEPGEQVAARYQQLDARARAMGSPLRAPYMTLSFMALLVIPELKLSDQGLFDGRSFSFVGTGAD